MRIAASLACSAAAALLAGCAAPLPAPAPGPIPLDLVLTRLKCEIAQALRDISAEGSDGVDERKLDISGWYIDGKLTAKTVVSDTRGGSFGTPQLVPLGSGAASFGFRLGGSVVRTTTATTIVDLFVSSRSGSVAVCQGEDAARERLVTSLGLYDWLKSLTLTRAGEPRMAFSNLSYQLDFGVVRSGGGGFDVAVVPVKASFEAKASRDDIQTLLVTMNPGKAAQAEAREALAAAGVPARRARVRASAQRPAPASGTAPMAPRMTPFSGPGVPLGGNAILDNDSILEER